MRVAIVTVSDSRAPRAHSAHTPEGVTDTSGDLIVRWIEDRNNTLVFRSTVADETVEVARALLDACDRHSADLVLTTGGTGLAPRDVTPEATLSVVERVVPGIAEALRAAGGAHVPTAMLSRGVAGIRGATLIINLPGSPGGVKDGLEVITRVADHAHAIMSGALKEHIAPPKEFNHGA